MTDPSLAGRLDAALAVARAGSTDGFTALYRDLAGPLAAFCRSRIGPDVDDVVNDVFLGAFLGLDSFEGDGLAFRAYLYRIARNKISDHRARSRAERERTTELEGLGERSGKTGDDVQDATLQRLAASEVEELLSTLTEDQREVIVLRFLAELTIAEVADITDRPQTAVKALQRRGLNTLRRRNSGAKGYPNRPSQR